MFPRTLLLVLLLASPLRAIEPLMLDELRMRAALRAFPQADRLLVHIEAQRDKPDGMHEPVSISHEVHSAQTIARIGGMLAGCHWDQLSRRYYSIDPLASKIVIICYCKGRKMDELKLVGLCELEHPVMGLFRTNSQKVNSDVLHLVLDSN